jgi:glycosyltransferase involved in cell wall biosynthesis
MSDGPALSVIIPTYQRRAALASTLAACGRQTLPPESYEVIVSVDERTAPAADEARGEAPYCLRWVCGDHGGPGAARNRGAALARAPLLLFLDDDIKPAPECLAEHLAAHAQAPSRVGLGRVQLAAVPCSPWERYLTSRYDEQFAKLSRPGYLPGFWDCLSGNLSLAEGLFNTAGGFDTGFRRHEDLELGYRLAALGAGFVYRPDALGWHCFQRNVEAGLRDIEAEGTSAGELGRRYPDLAARLVQARWQRYRRPVRALFRWVLADADRHRRAAAAGRRWAESLDRLPVRGRWHRPAYQWAAHLHFWLGLRAAAPELVPEV